MKFARIVKFIIIPALIFAACLSPAACPADSIRIFGVELGADKNAAGAAFRGGGDRQAGQGDQGGPGRAPAGSPAARHGEAPPGTSSGRTSLPASGEGSFSAISGVSSPLRAPAGSGPAPGAAGGASSGKLPGFTANVESQAVTSPTPSDSYPKIFPESLFSLYRKGAQHKDGPTLMVIGGIQGDEPGGFSAAALLVTHYTIEKGAVWIVPDLNFPSILQRSRGVHGDMNRKFAFLSESDPEYHAVSSVKNIILAPEVDLVLNLHDGSGYYRPEYLDKQHCPQRWGQCVIIDQAHVDSPKFGELEDMADIACADVNKGLLDEEHRYRTRNTFTSDGDKEMEKSLSYFAVCGKKPAFGVEASKDLPAERRAYYHLLVIESFMRQMGIEFTRHFGPKPKDVFAALNSGLTMAVYKDKLTLPLENIRPAINMLPFKKGATVEPVSSRPLLALVQDTNGWRIAYGNRTLATIKPDYMDFDDSLESVAVIVDGQEKTINMGQIFHVDKTFQVKGIAGYRVNAIGARKEVNGTESDVKIVRKDFIPAYSVDKDATIFRVEIYKGKAFAGMILARFSQDPAQASSPLAASESGR